MATILVVLLLAFGVLVGVTVLMVRGLPRFVWLFALRLGIAAVVIAGLGIPLSLHARAKAMRIGEALMEPAEFARGYERSTRSEWLGFCWVDYYTNREPHEPACWVSVDLFGQVDLGSKYFSERADRLGIFPP